MFEVGDLAYPHENIGGITVAGQRRDLTDFATTTRFISANRIERPYLSGFSPAMPTDRDGSTICPMAEGFHPPVEEYLTTIYELAEDGITVIQARLAERLGYSAPTVWEMVKRLTADGYVSVSGREISLTQTGRSLAESVVRKHRLAERLLTDVIGLPWHKAHIEAGRWEHVISDEVEERLRVILDDPNTCPHGNPIPGTSGRIEKLIALSDANPGDSIRLERVTETVEMDDGAMQYLADSLFITGSLGTVKSKAPDGTMSIQVGEDTVALGSTLSANLFVAMAT